MVIGVIGVGVVGKAVLQAFAHEFETYGYDIVGEYARPEHWKTIIERADVCFLCLPTPTINGNQRITTLRDTLLKLSQEQYRGVVVIKSTVLPGTTQAFGREFSNLRLVHNPEFLTAAKPYEDFLQQKAVLLGGRRADTQQVLAAYHTILPFAECLEFENPSITETAKYMRNNFLAVKVSLANEFAALCDHLEISYAQVLEAMLSQGGVEPGHWNVPGPDGKRGFSGMCLPKDIRAMLRFLIMKGLPCSTLEGAEDTNQIIRPHNGFCKEID